MPLAKVTWSRLPAGPPQYQSQVHSILRRRRAPNPALLEMAKLNRESREGAAMTVTTTESIAPSSSRLTMNGLRTTSTVCCSMEHRGRLERAPGFLN
jgi:hypothetical protein